MSNQTNQDDKNWYITSLYLLLNNEIKEVHSETQIRSSFYVILMSNYTSIHT